MLLCYSKVVFLSLSYLYILPLVGVLFIIIIPKNIEIIFLRRIKNFRVYNFFNFSNSLLLFDLKLFNLLQFVECSNFFLFFSAFCIRYLYRYAFLIDKVIYFSQLMYYRFLYIFLFILRDYSFFQFFSVIRLWSWKFLIVFVLNLFVRSFHFFFDINFIHQKLGIFFSFITFLYSLVLYKFFDVTFVGFQYQLHFFGVCFLGVDGFSIVFVILSTFLIFFCLSTNLSVNIYRYSSNFSKIFLSAFLFLDVFLILAFSVLDFFFFYIFFELILIPMLFIIGFFGSRSRKIRAMFYFVGYTILGSLFLLFGVIFYFTFLVSYVNFLFLDLCSGTISADAFFLVYEVYMVSPFLLFDKMPFLLQIFVFFCFFFGFAIKVPMVPFHLWLPEAHVEAPTAGSMLLAGILLKLGGYGFIRYLLPFGANIFSFIVPIIYCLGVISICYAGLVAIRQIDLKRIIAYSSVVHMNVGVLGLFSNTLEGLLGSVLLMLSHGVVAVGLFYLVGILYLRFGSRLIDYYGGLVQIMPLFSFYLFIFILGNIGFPGTFSFVGEVLNFIGIGAFSFIIFMLVCFVSMFISTVYNFWLYNRLIFANLKWNSLFFGGNYFMYGSNNFDLNLFEFLHLGFLVFLLFWLGVFPGQLIQVILPSLLVYLF